MLDFKKYSSIENSFDNEYIERVRQYTDPKLIYVVQEKVHGSNTSFITDGKTIKFAKRTALIGDDEKFFDYEELLERYSDKVKNLYQLIKKDYPEIDYIIVFGEFFGGYYPHKEVKKDTRFTAIQKGVCYCPMHEFYGFDIFLVSEKNDMHQYLGVEKCNAYFEQGGFYYAHTLFRGTLDECLKYPNDFESTIYKEFGYPKIEGNICEGVVIRPEVPTYIPGGIRVMIKNKNAKFAEKKSEKRRPKDQKPPVVFTDNFHKLIDKADLFVTENRLDNVISHIGEVHIPKDLGKLLGMYCKDIIDDFLKENATDFYDLDKNEQKSFNKQVNQLALKVIKAKYGMPQ